MRIMRESFRASRLPPARYRYRPIDCVCLYSAASLTPRHIPASVPSGDGARPGQCRQSAGTGSGAGRTGCRTDKLSLITYVHVYYLCKPVISMASSLYPFHDTARVHGAFIILPHLFLTNKLVKQQSAITASVFRTAVRTACRTALHTT